jgi:glycine reductase
LERAGIVTVIVTALPGVAQNIGCSRIVTGVSINHPLGNPALTRTEEKRLRQMIVDAAAGALTVDIQEQTVWQGF